MATGYAPLLDSEPELARTLAASVTQRIAFGERAGQHVRRIGPGFGYEGESPALTGPRCARLDGFSLHANTQIPAHRRDQLERLIRYTARGAVALERLGRLPMGISFTRSQGRGRRHDRHHTVAVGTFGEAGSGRAFAASPPRRYAGLFGATQPLRGAIIPTPRQQGVDGREASVGTPCWSWARLLKRVFDLDLSTCPLCRRGSLRIIAAITHEAVITRLGRF